MNTAGKVAIGILGGIAIGVAAGILLAPNSGKKTRKKLMSKSKELTDRVSKTYGDMKKTYNKQLDSLAGNGKAGIDTLKESMKV
ncbi:MAG: YtxH domain-containing protein [Cyclobacteriaceae bacterium]|nr:YtxH domain-containing protein [Cyclobacteriaceae bacterium]